MLYISRHLYMYKLHILCTYIYDVVIVTNTDMCIKSIKSRMEKVIFFFIENFRFNIIVLLSKNKVYKKNINTVCSLYKIL